MPGSTSRWLAGACLLALGLWHAAVSPLGMLQRLDLAFDDMRQQWSAPRTLHPDIVIVDIDEASLGQIGHWPWPRTQLAALSQELLKRQEVAAIAVDFVFPEATGNDDDALAAAWKGQPVIGGFYLTADRDGHRTGQLPAPLPRGASGGLPPALVAWTGYAANVSLLAEAASAAGFFNVVPDVDGLLRQVPAIAQIDGNVYPSLMLATLLTLTGEPAIRLSVPGEPSALWLEAAGQAPRRLPLDEHGALRVPFRGAAGPLGGSFRYVSAADVLAKRLAPGSLRGRVVLLGSSAPGLSDLRATPANGATPGVEVHANLLAGLLDGELPYRPSWASGYEALLLLLTLLSTGLLASWRSPPVALAGVAGLSALLLVSNASLYAQFKLVLPVASPLLLGTFFAAGLLARSYWLEWSERRSIVQLFDQYLPPERVKALVKEADPGLLQAENRELTLLFCDLQGFSALGERLPPLALRDLLNQFFSTATRIIHAEGGTLDKFIGDAVMAFWGAPQRQADHAERAVRAAVALKAAAGPLNASLAAQGLPSLKFGIGLATGVVCVGDLGSNLRRSYTAVGDAVNLAARIEALTREWGCGLLIADSTRQACGEAAQSWPWQEITQTQVRGRQQYVTLFTINDLPVALKPH